MSLELNILIFVAVIRRAKINLETERIKYFIVQRVGSSVFLISLVLRTLEIFPVILSRLMGFSLSLKLGVAPFHGWFVNVLRKLS